MTNLNNPIESILTSTIYCTISDTYKFDEENIKDDLIEYFSKRDLVINDMDIEYIAKLRKEFPETTAIVDKEVILGAQNTNLSLDKLFHISAKEIVGRLIKNSYVEIINFAFEYEPSLTTGRFPKIEAKEGKRSYNRSLKLALSDAILGHFVRIIKTKCS